MANGNLLYKPVVPSLGNISKDISTAMQQALQYKQQKERHEQQRKDMMFKNFLANTKVTPFAAVAKKNKEMLDEAMKNYEDKIQGLVAEIDGDEDDWETIRKGRSLAMDTQQEINRIKSYKEQNAADRVIISENSDEYSSKLKKQVFGHEGGKPQYKMRKMIPDWRKEIKKMKNEMYKGDEATFTVVNESTNKKITTKKELKEYFWEPAKGGGWKPHVEHQKDFFKNRIGSNDKLRTSLLNEFNVRGEKKGEGRDAKYKMPNKRTYGLDEIADYAYDEMGRKTFIMVRDLESKPIDEGGNNELTQTEKKQRHIVPQEGNAREYGGITFNNFVELGHRNLKGTINFDKKADLTDPSTGKEVNIKGSKGYIVGGVDPIAGKMIIGVEGYKKKKTPLGKSIAPKIYQYGVPRTHKDYTFFVADIDKYKGLLEQEEFFDQKGNLIRIGRKSTSKMDYDGLFE